MKKNFSFTAIVCAIVLTAGLFMVSSVLAAPVNVAMTTEVNEITHEGQLAWSIKQYGTDNPNDDIIFAFEKLNSVAGGQFAGYELLQVNLTFEFETSEATLTVKNNKLEQHTFGDDDEASLTTRFSGGGRKWDWGLADQSLYDDAFSPIAGVSDFEDEIKMELNDTITLEPEGEEGDSISEKGNFETFLTGTVNSLFKEYYEGSGIWYFDVNNSYPVTFEIDGSGDLSIEGTTPSGTFSTLVEFIATPEPSSALLLALGALFVAARRRF